MALTKCPECGRDKVSSEAIACPDCGFNIKEYYIQNPEKLYETEDSVTYISCFELEMITIFSNGIKEGVKGKAIDKRIKIPYTQEVYDYYVKNNDIYITRRAGTVRYIAYGNYLLNTNGKYNGNLPVENKFESTIQLRDTVYYFKRDGSFTETSNYSNLSGKYIRHGDLFAYESYNTGYTGNIIYNNELYSGSYVKQGFEQPMKDLFQELDAFFVGSDNGVCTVKPTPQPTNLPTCPTCGSTNVQHISSLERGASIFGFGVFSRKLNKTYKCLNCKYMW